ncbi:hypothetical protein GCM10010508_40950 [Streptomyces naganishii JCM 4654]|uniref:Restriction endonuclease domain-containing protein n=1 Tax=Streptomyces naganishii JCM 4654 TaxID=1306179 RepID=A0A919CY76_9ACTN|nr:hypothetical protein GCM10010508_40950 [Streptomyces naganishii JCM 4654]
MSSHVYQTLRAFVQSVDDALPGRFEIAGEGLVHDLRDPGGLHALTTVRIRKRLEKAMPQEIVAHTGVPYVEDESEGIMRRPDIMVIAEADMEGEGPFDLVRSSPPLRSSPGPTRTTTGSPRCATTP